MRSLKRLMKSDREVRERSASEKPMRTFGRTTSRSPNRRLKIEIGGFVNA